MRRRLRRVRDGRVGQVLHERDLELDVAVGAVVADCWGELGLDGGERPHHGAGRLLRVALRRRQVGGQRVPQVAGGRRRDLARELARGLRRHRLRAEREAPE